MLVVKKSNIIMALWILLLFRPTIIVQFKVLDSIVSFASNMMYIYVLIRWFLRRAGTDKWIRHIGFLFATSIRTTMINRGKINDIFLLVKVFAAILILEDITRNDREEFLRVTKKVLFLLVLLNLISLIVFPGGIIQVHREANEWYEYDVAWWLFGNKNSMMMWLVSLNLLTQISIYLKGRAQRATLADACMIGSTILTAILCESTNTIIAIFTISVFPLLYRVLSSHLGKFFLSPSGVVLFYILFTVILVTSNQLGIFEFVANAFGKDSTFTGRASAWIQSIILIARKPLLGYGILSEDTLRNLLGAYAFVNAHNTILQTLINGGLILGVQFLLIQYILGEKICSLSGNHLKERTLLIFTVLVLEIASSFESYTSSLLYWNILSIIYYTVDLLEEDDYCNEGNNMIDAKEKFGQL